MGLEAFHNKTMQGIRILRMQPVWNGTDLDYLGARFAGPDRERGVGTYSTFRPPKIPISAP